MCSCSTAGAPVDGVDLEIARGEFISIIGPSGSGKTTLLRSINGLEHVDGGEIVINNRKIDNEYLSYVQKKTGMIFQEYNLVNNLSSINNVLSGLLNSSSKFLSMFYLFTRKQKLQALQSLETVGLLDKAYSRVDQLSGGQRQRVGIARAIIKKPILLLADEPSTALDVTIQNQALDLMNDLTKETNTAVLLITHNMGVVRKFAEKVYVIYRGVIVEEGTKTQIFKNPGHPYTKALLKSIPKLSGKGLPQFDEDAPDYALIEKYTHSQQL